jgi:hypothetical protein
VHYKYWFSAGREIYEGSDKGRTLKNKKSQKAASRECNLEIVHLNFIKLSRAAANDKVAKALSWRLFKNRKTSTTYGNPDSRVKSLIIYSLFLLIFNPAVAEFQKQATFIRFDQIGSKV